MNRGRLIFWGIAGTVIASGVGAILYLQSFAKPHGPMASPFDLAAITEANRAKADQAPEPWTPPETWWKVNTIDAYDRVNAGVMWPSARRAVVAFGADLANGPLATSDEGNDARTASEAAFGFECTEPLVSFIWSRYRLDDQKDRVRAMTAMIQAAKELRDGKKYPAFVRCLAMYEAAPSVATRFSSIPTAESEMLDAAEALWPEVAADRDIPLAALSILVTQIDQTCSRLKLDQRKRVEPLLVALEKAGHPKSVVQTVRGIYLTHYAWDARGSGFAGAVTEAGWRGFKDRLTGARAALTEAWEADNKNSIAAEAMITVCMGDSSDRPEMEKWFKRAMAANPGNELACSRKMLYLEPKWGGSVPAMILFGRELLRSSSGPNTPRVPLILADTHWKLSQIRGSGEPSPAYFADNADVWSDISGACEHYLKHVPNSRYHRTRYAVMAGWAGKWDVCAKQFELLGDRYRLSVVDEPVLKALRDRARRESSTGATR